MRATLVGGDRLGNIPELLKARGIRVLRHVSGRDASDQRRTALPRDTDLLILFTDFLNDNAMRSFRAAAQDGGVPVLDCRRSTSALSEALTRLAPRHLAGVHPVCAARD